MTPVRPGSEGAGACQQVTMSSHLAVSIGQHSDRGQKPVNQDFQAVLVPTAPQLSSKGIVVALADGISSSDVSHIASKAAVSGFLEDYFCTSDAWSVKKSAQCVLAATNSWLHSQTQQSQHRFNKDKGYVCTFSAVVFKFRSAYVFHVGDARVYRLRDGTLEQLTSDHRLWVSQEQSYLSRALGMNPAVEIDYQELATETGDIFILSTDGVYEHVSTEFITETVADYADDLPQAAQLITAQALLHGSRDNLTVQIVRIDELPCPASRLATQPLSDLPAPPILEARRVLDGFKIIRSVHSSSRSHVYLAVEGDSQVPVIIKAPSLDLQGDAAYLERFMLEEWIARRIDSPYVLKPRPQVYKRNFLYLVTEFIDGQTLSQWMIDNPRPGLAKVRAIVEQIAKGLLAFHRLEMLHQDLRPENIMIDRTGTVKIIDFGSTRVAGIQEQMHPAGQQNLLGTAQYSAPEYFIGESGTPGSDLFSLAVITYQMLTGYLPYGTQVAKSRTRAAQHRLVYRSALDDERDIPAWIDDVLKKALHPNPLKRYRELSEFVYDLGQPTPEFLNKTQKPLMERNPVRFWQTVSLILAIALMTLLINSN